MTEKQVQDLAAQAIAEMPLDQTRYYHVCWWEERLQCLHVHHTKDHHPVFYSAPGSVFANGPSSHQWRLMTARITDFFKSRGITRAGRITGGGRRTRAESVRERLQITEFDSRRLHALLASARTPGSPTNAYLDKLQRLLETADTVAPEDVPEDVVTMNSRVHLKDEHQGSEMTLSLVFPTDALRDTDFEKMKVSILTPIGLSLLGRRVGDAVEGHIRVHKVVYQPEAAGDFHL